MDKKFVLFLELYLLSMLVRIRDFFRIDDMIFTSTKYSSKEKKEVKCLLRYIRDPDGSRGLGGESYRKLGFDESFGVLENTDFVDEEQGVQLAKKEEIDEIYRPEDGFSEDELSHEVFELFSEEIPEPKIGVTGSRLLGLNKAYSDIDLVFYGYENFKKARKLLLRLIEKNKLEELNERDHKKIYKQKNPPFSFKTYLNHAKRKFNRAKYKKRKLDLLFVRSRDELPQEDFDGNIGDNLVDVTSTVTSDRYVFDLPIIYGVNHRRYSKIISFSHVFAGQAFESEEILARGREMEGRDVLVAGAVRKPREEFVVSRKLYSSTGDSV